jgi:preprotein translocase subunit SecA
MIEWTLKKIIGTKNERELKRAWPKVARINALEPRMLEPPMRRSSRRQPG